MILITGGMGFIGMHTARRFLDAGEGVVLTQHRARREPAFLKDDLDRRARVEALDVADGEAVQSLVKRHGITGIVHLAFPGLESPSVADDYRTAMLGWLNVLEAARLGGVSRVALASSNAVYGGVPTGPFREDMPLPVESRNVIEAFKKAKEILGFHYADRTGLSVVAMRIVTIYGPAYYSGRNLPSRLCHAAVSGTAPDIANVFGRRPLAGDTNDYCYVKDCAAAIYVLQTAATLPNRTYNIGGGRSVTNAELAGAVNAAIPGANMRLPPGENPGAKSDNYADIAQISRDTGFEPRYDIHRGIADYIGWLRENPQ